MGNEDRGYCPKCGMELLEFTYQAIRIDQCSGCGGVWLDRGELEQVERAEKGMLLSKELRAKWLQAWERRQAGSPVELEGRKTRSHMRCPRCDSDLEEVEDHGVSVGRCTACGGIWLDPGGMDELAGVAHGLMTRLHWFLYGCPRSDARSE